MKTASEMTYTVSGGALNSAQPTNQHMIYKLYNERLIKDRNKNTKNGYRQDETIAAQSQQYFKMVCNDFTNYCFVISMTKPMVESNIKVGTHIFRY